MSCVHLAFTSICNAATGTSYLYRADGMRVLKVEGLTVTWVPPGEEEASGHYDENWAQNLPTTRYYYDGQMTVEDDYTITSEQEAVVTVMRYGVGARGIDFLGRSHDGGAETKGFPVYDGHGNMIATLARSESSPYFGIADQRSYDVWGGLRYSQSSGDPKQRYCANLGHVQDDESGLIYMRARYYEPWSGRFVSEDPARDGGNWFVYAENNPVSLVDENGESFASEIVAWLGSILIFVGAALAVKNLLSVLDVRKLIWNIKREIVHKQWLRQTADLPLESPVRLATQVENAINNMVTFTKIGVGRAQAAMASYALVIFGYFLWMLSEFIDPYSPNKGAFIFME